MISVFGLGKLGLCMAACFSIFYKVYGVDINKDIIKSINNGDIPSQEPNLYNIIKENKCRLICTNEVDYAITNSCLSFVIVPTPSDSKGAFKTIYLEKVLSDIGKSIKEKDDFHVIVITSTVLPGSMDYVLKRILEKESDKKCGIDFGLCYSPEFIALGSVIKNFLSPDMILIGESDTESGNLVEEIYKVCTNATVFKRMSYINAEITKIAVNSFITSKITFANSLSNLCNNISNSNVDVITDAIGEDSRIGKEYLKGGLGFGGPCFPRDNRAFNFIHEAVNAENPVADKVDKINSRLVIDIIRFIISRTPKKNIIAILGLSYKPGSIVIEESQSIVLAKHLSLYYDIICYDPLVKDTPYNLYINDSIIDTIINSDAVVIANNDPEFYDLPVNIIKNKLIFDIWRILYNKKDSLRKYFSFGTGCNSDVNESSKLKEFWENYSIKRITI